MSKINKGYFIVAVLLLVTEVCIGMFLHDMIIRPYGGDFLVVILLYCLLKSFFEVRLLVACVSVLLLSYTIELLQYFNFLKILRIDTSSVARTIAGNSFDPGDLLAYTLGVVFVLAFEKIIKPFKTI